MNLVDSVAIIGCVTFFLTSLLLWFFWRLERDDAIYARDGWNKTAVVNEELRKMVGDDAAKIAEMRDRIKTARDALDPGCLPPSKWK